MLPDRLHLPVTRHLKERRKSRKIKKKSQDRNAINRILEERKPTPMELRGGRKPKIQWSDCKTAFVALICHLHHVQGREWTDVGRIFKSVFKGHLTDIRAQDASPQAIGSRCKTTFMETVWDSWQNPRDPRHVQCRPIRSPNRSVSRAFLPISESHGRPMHLSEAKDSGRRRCVSS